MKESFSDHDDVGVGVPSLWQENHGNLLMGFVASILIVGASILLYQQSLPEAESIPVPVVNSEDPAQVAAVEEPSVYFRLQGAANDEGALMVAVYDTEEVFNRPAESTISTSVEVGGGQGTWRIPISQLPERMAVAAYHDENLDGVLNKNPLGIPTERYGFSRNARGLTGPPSFFEAVIDRPSEATQIEIVLR